MKIKVKRAYDEVVKNDGFRVLVDRLWPRGVNKLSAKIDVWAKDVAPSNKLRAWFHKNKEARFKVFSKRYKQEMVKGGEITKLKKMLHGKEVVTIVTGVKDIEHSHILALVKMLRFAIEVEEDNVLNAIAQGRDTSSAKFVSHKVAWR